MVLINDLIIHSCLSELPKGKESILKLFIITNRKTVRTVLNLKELRYYQKPNLAETFS